MRLVLALGGNALRRRGEETDPAAASRNLRAAVSAVAGLAEDHTVVVTHGNGPQVGLLALQAASLGAAADPLDVLGAESEGMIGYLLQQGLTSVLPGRQVVTLLTQVVVDAHDPAFGRPTKPIGPAMDAVAAGRVPPHWEVREDGGGFRRVVASPEPRELLELPAIRILVDAGVLVICAGGGGIPVRIDAAGAVHGVEAVVDKDLTACLLAEGIGADGLVMLTDVDAVYLGWGGPGRRPLLKARPDELRRLGLPPGSMGPKAEAAARFVERTGGWAAIGSLDRAADVVAGIGGTRVGS